MTALQKILVAIVAAEAAAAGGLWLKRSAPPALPPIRKAALDPETARELSQLEATLRPERVEDWLRLAEVCRAFNLLADAERCYRAYERLAPRSTEHLFDWAVTLSRLGETREAAPILERVIAAGGPQADTARWFLARDRLREEDVPAAEQRLRQLKDSPNAAVMLARLLIRTGRAPEAQAMLDQWLRSAPDELHLLQLRAWAAEELGDAATARIQRMIALRCRDWAHPKDAATARDEQVRQQFGHAKLLGQISALEAQGKWDEASAQLQQALATAWNDQDAGRLVAIEMKAGRPRRAIAEIEQLIAAVGAGGESLLALGRAWLAEGEVQKAWEYGLKAEELGASYSAVGKITIQQFLSEVATRRNDSAAARAHQARGQLELGMISLADNNVAQAHQQFLRATTQGPEQSAAWFYLGETSAILGDAAGARRSYGRCLELNPNHGRAIEALAQLR